MERSLLKSAFTNSQLVAFINATREAYLKRTFWQMLFPLVYTTQLTWESLTGSAGAPVMADVIEYNSSSPEKTRRVLTKATGDIPKIGIKRKMDEKDWNDYNVLKALANDSNKSALLDLVFNDIEFCYTGVLARTEHLCLQALSYGSLALDANNNNGVITETTVDLGIPSGNKTASAVTWATAATATPIADIKTVVKASEEAGRGTPMYALMDRATFNYMVATTEVKTEWQGFTGSSNAVYLPTFEQVNNLLMARGLPRIMIMNSSVRFENGEHTLSTIAPWKTGYVTFVGDLRVGKTLHGPIAEENAPSVKNVATMTKNGHVLISKWSQLEPFGEWTKGQANAFPVFNDADSLYILKTNATTWS